MTSRERFLCAGLWSSRGSAPGGGIAAAPDRVPADATGSVPVAPYLGNFGARFAGIPLSVYNSDPRSMAKAHIFTQEAFGYDVAVAQSDNYYIAQGFGCRINQPYDSTPNLIEPAVPSLDRIGELKIPDPYKDGRMPVYLEAVNLLRSHFGDRVAVRGPGTGPFSLASYLMGGTEEFLMEIATAEAEEDHGKERQLFELMEISSDALIAFLKALLLAGSDCAQAGDSLASLSMISPSIYVKYVFPYEKKVFSAIKALTRERGAVTILHICGDTRAILPLMAETGADILEIDAKVDIGEARALTAGKVALMGNLDPTSVLYQGTPQSVRQAALECLRAADALSGGFILGSGCEVVPGTPAENMRAMVAAVRDFAG